MKHNCTVVKISQYAEQAICECGWKGPVYMVGKKPKFVEE